MGSARGIESICIFAGIMEEALLCAPIHLEVGGSFFSYDNWLLATVIASQHSLHTTKLQEEVLVSNTSTSTAD